MNKKHIISILIGIIVVGLVFSPILLVNIRYKEAVENCKSNGWDMAGIVGAILDYNYECYNYTKAKRDALRSKDVK